MNQYRAGTVSYLNVIVAQTTALTNERVAVDIAGQENDGDGAADQGAGRRVGLGIICARIIARVVAA